MVNVLHHQGAGDTGSQFRCPIRRLQRRDSVVQTAKRPQKGANCRHWQPARGGLRAKRTKGPTISRFAQNLPAPQGGDLCL
jgi:hypothetical protein